MKKYLLLLILLIPVANAFELDILNTDPAPIIAGESADVTIKLTDLATRQGYEDVTIEFIDNEDVRAIGSKVENVGRFAYTEAVTRTFRIFFAEDLPSGMVNLKFAIQSNLGRQEIIKDVFVSDAASLPDLRIGQIESIPEELLEDTNDNKIIVSLQNLGETKAELLNAEIKYNSQMIKPSSSFSLQDSVASIDAGGEAELEFTFDILEEVKSDIPITINLRYRSRQSISDNYRIFENSLRTVLPLADSPVLKVVKVESEELKTGTTDNKITVTIKNEGSKEAEDVRIRMHPDISYPFIFDATTHYITSELDPQEETTFQFEAEVTQRGTTRSYPIAIELESLVGETLYSREDTITLDVKEAVSVSNRAVGLGIIGVIVVIALGFTVYHKTRKKKK